MTTASKPVKVPRSVVLTVEEDRTMLELRAFHTKKDGKNCTINDVIRKALIAHADALGI